VGFAIGTPLCGSDAIASNAGCGKDSLAPRTVPGRPPAHIPLISSGEMKHRLFMVVLVIAIVLATTGWLYALGWVALKLI
jgi:hypothetical protein